MNNKLVKIFTNLTFAFAVLALVEMFIGLCAEMYMESYLGSFFEVELPYIFVVTILLSILSNLTIVIIEYFSRNGNI